MIGSQEREAWKKKSMERAMHERMEAGKLRSDAPGGFSLDGEMISAVFEFAKPLGHYEDREQLNLGFGFLYYGLIRVLRPDHVLVIGSGYGFSVVCLALGLKDNDKGLLTFVDPSYDLLKDGPFKTVGGRGYWDDPEKVIGHFSRFGIQDRVTHYKLSNKEFFPRFDSLGLPAVDVAFLDGNHAFENVRYDFLHTLLHSKKNTYMKSVMTDFIRMGP